MKLTTTSKWTKFDWGIIITTVLLVFISLATLYSLEINQPEPNYTFFSHQAIATTIGAAIVVLFLFLDFRILKDWAYILYALGVLLLIIVLFFGIEIRGTIGWFSLGGVTFQPVEIFKVIFVIALAKFYSGQMDVNRWQVILKSLGFLIVPAMLIYLQPDLGSMFVLVVIWFVMLFIMKLRPYYILLFFLTLMLSAAVAWQFWLAPYQKTRVNTFFNSMIDPTEASYHVRQSKIAVGSGRLWGRGLGLGTQSSLDFLPEQETDFVFAVICEALGLLGGMFVMGLFVYMLWRILRLSIRLRGDFESLLAIGFFAWFAFQGLANIAMNLGLMPVFGVPLPFLSYGGSSLISSFVGIGILESASLYSLRET